MYRVESLQALNEFTSSGTVLVNYGAPHCPPCKTLQPILEQLEADFEQRVSVAYVDCDRLPDAASAVGVMGTPTVVIFKDGQAMDKLVGLRPRAAYQLAVEKLL